jgi:catechol 2,3-dioxygenase-like lactoylglutathione lyase family enzyme
VYVEERDEALAFYTERPGVETRDDVEMEAGGRWLAVGLPGDGFEPALVEPRTDDQRALVGAQGGDDALLVVDTEDCRRDAETLRDRGVEVRGEPREEAWGVGVTVEDLYGNAFYLLVSTGM